MGKSDKSDNGWPDDGREWRELTEVDILRGERVARELEEKVRAETEHFHNAHSKDPIDGIMNAIFGTSEDCIEPSCRSEEKRAEFEALEEERYGSESWWERWSREREEKREERRFFAEIEAEDDSESWWQRWFRGSNNGGDGEGGSD